MVSSSIVIVAAVIGALGVWFSSMWIAHIIGEHAGRSQALEDALGGHAWLARGCPADAKIADVARALALAQVTLGRRAAITRTGQPSAETMQLAMAAVSAMRMPSREMIEAVTPYIDEAWHESAVMHYELMIEAALNPGPNRARAVTPEGVEVVRRTLLPLSNGYGHT